MSAGRMRSGPYTTSVKRPRGRHYSSDPSGTYEPKRGARSRVTDARQRWHLRTSHQPPSLSTR